MKFLTGKPFPTLQEYCEIKQKGGIGIQAEYFEERSTFREGCIQEAIEISRKDWADLTDEELQCFVNYNELRGNHIGHQNYYSQFREEWLFGLLEASLGEK